LKERERYQYKRKIQNTSRKRFGTYTLIFLYKYSCHVWWCDCIWGWY